MELPLILEFTPLTVIIIILLVHIIGTIILVHIVVFTLLVHLIIVTILLVGKPIRESLSLKLVWAHKELARHNSPPIDKHRLLLSDRQASLLWYSPLTA